MNQRYTIPRRSQEEPANTLCVSPKKAFVDAWGTDTDGTWVSPSPVSLFRYDPRKFIRNMFRKIDRLVLNELVSYSHLYRHVFVSQSTIAANIGYTRSEVNKSIGRLKSFGLVRAIYRHWQPSIYKLTSLFKLKRVINKIGSFITSLLTYNRKNHTQLNLLVSSKLNSITMSCISSNLTYNSKRALPKSGTTGDHFTKSTRCCPLGVRPSGGRVMTKEEIGLRVKAIEKLAQVIDLSKYGKARMSIFPDAAIYSATHKLINSIKGGVLVRDPFAYTYELSHKAAIELKIPLNFSLFDRYSFVGTENPLTSDTITLPTTKGRKMYLAYKPWEKPVENLDPEKELQGYEKVEQSTYFKEFQRILGPEISNALLKKCKHNVVTKAMQNT